MIIVSPNFFFWARFHRMQRKHREAQALKQPDEELLDKADRLRAEVIK